MGIAAAARRTRGLVRIAGRQRGCALLSLYQGKCAGLFGAFARAGSRPCTVLMNSDINRGACLPTPDLRVIRIRLSQINALSPIDGVRMILGVELQRLVELFTACLLITKS